MILLITLTILSRGKTFVTSKIVWAACRIKQGGDALSCLLHHCYISNLFKMHIINHHCHIEETISRL